MIQIFAFLQYRKKTIYIAKYLNAWTCWNMLGIIQGGAKCGDNELPGVFVSLTDEVVLEFVLEKSGLKKGE